MARGDYVRVVYRTGSGTAEEKIAATAIGASIRIEHGKVSDAFVEVAELNKAGKSVRTAQFAKSETIALIEGHEMVRAKAPTKVSR